MGVFWVLCLGLYMRSCLLSKGFGDSLRRGSGDSLRRSPSDGLRRGLGDGLRVEALEPAPQSVVK